MKYPVRLAKTAIQDLKKIRRWVAQEAGKETADVYVDRITSKFLLLESYPLKGTPRDEISPGFRSIPFERKIVIFYRVIEHEVWIERFIHGRMVSEEVF